MKYVLLGTLSKEWAERHGERTDKAKAKLKELNMTLDAVYYTQGMVDFVDVVDAPDAEAVLAFSIWYVKQGFGRVQSLPAFDDGAMRGALKKAG